MKKSITCAVLLIFVGCLAASRANAQQVYLFSLSSCQQNGVDCDSSVDLVGGTVLGYSSTEVDYWSSYDYDAYVDGRLCNEFGTVCDEAWEQAPVMAQVFTSLPADFDTLYVERGQHDVIAKYYQEIINKGPEGCFPCDGCNDDCYYFYDNWWWWDPFGYSFRNNGGWGPWRQFFGFGPPVQIENDEDIPLGETDSFLQTAKPDHLLLGNDLISNTTCGGVRRQIDYVVVDNSSRHRVVTNIQVVEDPDGSKTDSCSNQTVAFSINCFALTTLNPIMEDDLKTGCPGSDSCGFDVPDDKWNWCKSNSNKPTLAKLNYSVHYNEIKVDGEPTAFHENTEFFANGTFRRP